MRLLRRLPLQPKARPYRRTRRRVEAHHHRGLISLYPVVQSHGVIHLPEHIELELQDFERPLLLRPRAKALERGRERKIGIAIARD